MHTLARLALVGLVFASTAESLRAADDAPVMGKPGKLLYQDDFSHAEVKPQWRVGLGFWAIHEGVMVVEENPADKHGAYAYAQPGFGYKDIVAEYSFKLDGSTNCDLKMEDSNYKASHAGHIIRASITPKAVVLGDSKYGSMENTFYAQYNDPKATPEQKKQLQAGIKDKSATFKVSLDLAKWHQARVEVVGDEMLISIDGKIVGYLKSAGVDHPTKNLIGFTIGGKSTQLDNFKVWDATPAPGWEARRASVAAAVGKAL
ncbi:MAG: hypothetical protein JWO94_130 [Verrucomicrobiaceae bacterium]|nr:hypothetical protein [Verrucomicrobiaceae bacterium]